MEDIRKIVFVLHFTGLFLFYSIPATFSQQSSGQLFEKALYSEEVKGELQHAIELYQQILKNHPESRQTSAKALLHMGMCYEKLGLKQARQTYQDIIIKYPEQKTEVLAAKERVMYLEAYVADISRKAEQHLKVGNELFGRWEYEAAIEEYENAIKLNPNTLMAQNAQYCIGQSWFRAGHFNTALVTFENLIKEFPESTIIPVTELMVAQVQHALKNNKDPGMINKYSDENIIIDPETGITYTKIKTFTGKSDVITYTHDLNLSPNGKYLLSGNTVVPMNGTAPFELIDKKTTGTDPTRGTWSPNGSKAAFFSGDALCVVPVSHETGRTTGPLKKIHMDELKFQSNPGWSPNGEKLTFYNHGDIWTISTDGSTLKQITRSMEDRETGPAWSPDGNTIAYGRENRSIWVYSVKEGKSSEFVDVGFRCFPVWSPDGKWLLVERQKLRFYNVKDKSQFEFSPLREAGSFYSWSPDDQKMLFFRSSYNYNTGLKVTSTAGGPSFEPVPHLTNWGKVVWSYNNQLMAVQGEDEKGNIDFRIVPLAGGKSYVINLDNLVDGKPFPFTISSDLQKLLFTVDRKDGTEDLFTVPISAEEARIIGTAVKIFNGWYREGPFNVSLSESNDGEKVALKHEGDIWMAFTNGDHPIQVTDTPEKEGYTEWISDGKTLLYATPSGWRLLENPGSESKVIKLLDEGNEIECRSWSIDFSPDNTRFAILSNDEIKIISRNGATSNQILNFKFLELINSYNLTWSPDGEYLAFVGHKETDDPDSPEFKCNIYIIPAKGGKPILVAQDDDDYKFGISWSPDGKWIAYGPEKPVKVRPESTIWEADFEEIKEKLLRSD